MCIYVFGHKNPDADSICSPIAVANLLNKIGKEAKACAQGEPSKDAKFLLDKFGFETPELIKSVKDKDVAVVDTTETKQLPRGMKNSRIRLVVDHHNLGSLQSSGPIEMWVRPYGCSGTIVKEMYESYGVKIDKQIAGLLCGAILNDTVMKKSPTTTETDRKAISELAKIAGIKDINAFGMEMFKIKSDIDQPAEELITRDFKNFTINKGMFGIGQLELIDVSFIMNRKDELIKKMTEMKKRDGYNTIILTLTDIMKEGSYILTVSDDKLLIDKAFDIKLQDNMTEWLPGIMSRKKQIVPPLIRNSWK